MKKKIMLGLLTSLAVILPVSSASAASETEAFGTSSFEFTKGYLAPGDVVNFYESREENTLLGTAVVDTVDPNWGSLDFITTTTSIANYKINGWAIYITKASSPTPSPSPSASSGTGTPAPYSPMSIFDNVKGWLTGSLLPAIAGLVILGISVRLAIKAVRKFSNVA
jgi:hypothetical protein